MTEHKAEAVELLPCPFCGDEAHDRCNQAGFNCSMEHPPLHPPRSRETGMIKTITYHSQNANPYEQWIAYIIMANGQRWNVAAFAVSEDEAIEEITNLWAIERSKIKIIDPWGDIEPKQHHLAGKIWMIHKETRNKVRISLTEITMYENKGYIRGGPRSQ